MKIYTRGGDGGETGLFGGPRLLKSAGRVSAYGEVDELCATLGWCALEAYPDLGAALERECARLFTLGSHLATPGEASASARAQLPSWPADACAELEQEIDAWDAQLEPLRNFILPGGSEAAARLHLARAVCRRAERAVVALASTEPVDALQLAYLNRLSDWLFTAARAANHRAGCGDRLWLPGPSA